MSQRLVDAAGSLATVRTTEDQGCKHASDERSAQLQQQTAHSTAQLSPVSKAKEGGSVFKAQPTPAPHLPGSLSHLAGWRPGSRGMALPGTHL